jgi:hypothetical protein
MTNYRHFMPNITDNMAVGMEKKNGEILAEFVF